MAVYRPKRNGTASKFYVCEFVYQGKRVQESTGCKSKTAAKAWEEDRRRDLERAHAGLPVDRNMRRISTVAELISPYLAGYRLTHRASSTKFATIKLRNVERLLGAVMLSDLDEERIREYVRERMTEDVSGTTINHELGELSRAIGRPRSLLWPKLRKLEERRDVGRALSPEEQERLLDAASALRSQIVRTVIQVLFLTGMRPGEAISLQWSQVDLFEGIITVGRAKTSSGTGRVIPLNSELAGLLAYHRDWFAEHFGDPLPHHYLFPFGSPQPTQPDRPVTDITSGWDSVRKASNVRCRLHDLRHTFCTRLAEAGVPESTMLALMGHMSRAMLERYSHIRMAAKRDAVAGVTLRPNMLNSGMDPVKVPVVTTFLNVQ